MAPVYPANSFTLGRPGDGASELNIVTKRRAHQASSGARIARAYARLGVMRPPGPTGRDSPSG